MWKENKLVKEEKSDEGEKEREEIQGGMMKNVN